MSLSGWCSPGPTGSARKCRGCRWALCGCRCHRASSTHTGETGGKRETMGTQREPDRANESGSLATVSTKPKGA